MCMEDIIIGRQKHSSYKTVAIDTSPARQVAAAAPYRTRIAFSCIGDNALVGPLGENVSNTIGLLVSMTKGILEFDVEQYGDIVRGAWVACANLNPATIAVVETFLDRKE